MDPHAVFKKSAKGQEAFAQRSPELSMRQRSLLIMVDGKRNVGDLARVGAAFGDLDTLLGELLAMGMVEAIGGSSQAAPTAPAAVPTLTNSVAAPADPVATPAPAVPRSLSDARRFAVRSLIDAMGPAAETHCMRIEATKNATDLQAMGQRAAEMLATTRGKSVGQKFFEDFMLRMPL